MKHSWFALLFLVPAALVAVLLSQTNSAVPEPPARESRPPAASQEVPKDAASIAKLVDRYVFEPGAAFEPGERMVLRFPQRFVQRRLWQLLRSEERRSALFRLEGTGTAKTAPLARVCDLLERFRRRPRREMRTLIAILEVCPAELRERVYQAFDRLSPRHGLRGWRKALGDESEYVRHSALCLARDSLAEGHLDPLMTDAYFVSIAKLLGTDDSSLVIAEAANLLLRFDRRRAVELLLRDESLALGHRHLDTLLEVFVQHRVAVPRERLVALAGQLAPVADEYPSSRVLGFVLTLLGAHRQEEDRPLLERYVEHEDEELATGALRGLQRSHELRTRDRDAGGHAFWYGWDALTDPEKHLVAVQEMLEHLRDPEERGFLGYFRSNAASHWPDALDGLEAMGAVEHAAMLKAALEQFPRSAPPTDRSERMAQLDEMLRASELPFEDADAQWIVSDERLELLRFRYDLSHPQGRARQ